VAQLKPKTKTESELLQSMLAPDRAAFAADPLGYSGSAWHVWQSALMVGGAIQLPREIPVSEDLKDPILWLCHAHALSEAASLLIKARPAWDAMPLMVRGVCDCQFCAVALMLMGYSLESCLKAMLIMRQGINEYLEQEKKFQHHRLDELSSFMPMLSEKDKAILKALSHFSYWAGRYPDPGSKRIADATEIFSLSEEHEISAKELVSLANRVMKHVQTMAAP
jgi:hypothetical protein